MFPGLVTKQQAVEFPQVLASNYYSMHEGICNGGRGEATPQTSIIKLVFSDDIQKTCLR